MSIERRTVSQGSNTPSKKSPIHTNGSKYRLITVADTVPDIIENIHTFDSFKRLRIIYQSLRELPEDLLSDWITCCTTHISHDVDGKNTQEENQQNARIGALFHHFYDRYTFTVESEKNLEIRKTIINKALLELLRSLLGKPCRLANEILELSGYPAENE
jgi:hypothetical protein